MFFHTDTAQVYVTTHMFGEVNDTLDETISTDTFNLDMLQNQSFRDHVANQSINMTLARKQAKTEKALSKVAKMTPF